MDRPETAWLQPLAEAVRARRTKLGLTQQEVSVLAGCGPVFIYDVESGRKATLRLDKLLDVLHVLGLQLALEPGQHRLRVSEPTT
ncbi:helix-turn-helix domain-containing protein [Corallococcus exercitus]|uniref:Helix-turn-helix transcriptional regulator n=1 Tax=Corallococcus exercitus TaxID=2316736 RepID=A0A7Y4NEB5_9BACT|nr:helix-turn-helix domain-containing protein [Corallococcus exercitus]NOK09730.1 helix-turn-helix transcriptional regulator [Corallococcus exercitus]